jgi:glycyl-tRNA synthetase beta chain
MAETRDLLLEIGTEELPPKALRGLAEALHGNLLQQLEKAGLAFESSHVYAAPRRLAVWIRNLAAGQQEKQVERRGPALTASFDGEGLPTPAASGFARSCGVEVDQLDKLETDKGAWLVHRMVQAGHQTAQLLPDMIDQALQALPIPKRMRWADLDAEFVRPVHWVVLLLGDEVIDTEILGVKAGRETRGHRFHHPNPLYIAEPAAYAPLLETEGHVLVNMDDRREAIRAQVIELAVAVDGRAVIDDALLDEVTALVEWPVAVRGAFDARYLDVPEEALISSMQSHQKYFPVKDAAGRLLPYFITVANIDSRNVASVQAGNERVIRPRLDDARFFFEQDLKTPLEDNLERLDQVVFQQQLGTLLDKTRRVEDLADWIGRSLNLPDPERNHAKRAAELAKCDLVSDMVGEFPELQGIMGRHYAVRQGEPDAVAQAIDEHYMPRFAGDALPASRIGQVVAIADKMDTLCGIFAIGQIPSGTRDPFALRRAALGVLRIITECRLDLDLKQLIDTAMQRFTAMRHFNDVSRAETLKKNKKARASKDPAAAVMDFMIERLRHYLLDEGIRPDVFEAVLERLPTGPYDFVQRVEAVSRFRQLPEAESLAAANKRIHNILRQAEQAIPETVDENLLQHSAEQVLARQVAELTVDVLPMLEQRQYTDALTRLAGLRNAVDDFFDQVMVMVDDEALRANRLALLQQLRNLFMKIADLSRLQT